MKKILYFHHAIGDGGAPRSLSLLISGLQKTDFTATVVMPDRPGSDLIGNRFREAGAELIKERHIRPFNGSQVAPCKKLKDRAYAVLSYQHLVKTAKRLVSDIRPDLVHLNSTCLVGAAKGAHQAISNVPVIAHVREPLLPNWWGRMLARMNRRHVDHFISIDDFGLESIGGLDSGQADVVRNFVDPSIFKPNEKNYHRKRDELGWKPNETIFLSLSRVCAHNGAAEMTQLVEQTSSELDPSAKFVVAGFHGNTPYEQHTKSLIDKSIRCHALPFDRNPADLINAADVIVAPFTTAHSARSVFEGAATGKPAIVSDLPNLTELIVLGKTGFKFQFSNSDSFVKAANQLCSSQFRRSLGEESLRFAEQNFFLDTNVKKTVAVYEKLLKGSNK